MLTTNNNILFDDLAMINIAGRSDQLATIPYMYGDCDNRNEAGTAKSLSPDCHHTSYTESLIPNGDCGN